MKYLNSFNESLKDKRVSKSEEEIGVALDKIANIGIERDLVSTYEKAIQMLKRDIELVTYLIQIGHNNEEIADRIYNPI